jgi:hypothetical protein
MWLAPATTSAFPVHHSFTGPLLRSEWDSTELPRLTDSQAQFLGGKAILEKYRTILTNLSLTKFTLVSWIIQVGEGTG